MPVCVCYLQKACQLHQNAFPFLSTKLREFLSEKEFSDHQASLALCMWCLVPGGSGCPEHSHGWAGEQEPRKTASCIIPMTLGFSHSFLFVCLLLFLFFFFLFFSFVFQEILYVALSGLEHYTNQAALELEALFLLMAICWASMRAYRNLSIENLRM